jgi:hypothetical protein
MSDHHHAAGLGHNRPPYVIPDHTEIIPHLDETYIALTERAAVALSGLSILPATITTEDQAETATENLRIATTFLGIADARRLEEGEPYRAGQRTVNGWFERLTLATSNAVDRVRAAMLAYNKERDRLAREARRIEAAKLQEEAELLAAKAAAAMQNPTTADVTETRLQEAGRAAQAAADAMDRLDAPPAANTRTRGVYGAVSSVRRTWKWRVTNLRAVPLEYLTTDDAKIRLAARVRDPKTGKPTMVIPGIEWVPEDHVAVR